MSLAVREGETLAFLGPNGSGKSTILRCIAGLMRPTSGAVTIAGQDPRVPSTRAMFSYLPQQVVFPENLTAGEVLAFYARLRGLSVERARAVMDELEVPDRTVSEFSGGMRQRLGIAVAMLPEAPLLILDEPTASLDPRGAIELRALLAGLKARGTTIAFTSHVLADAEELADRVAILVGGRLAALETVDALRGRLARNASIEEVYLKYVEEMDARRSAPAGDDRVREYAAAC